MKFVKLLTSAYVGGVLRHPHEGVLHVSDDDAQRLLDNKAAQDVSGDFPASKNLPPEPVSAVPDDAAATSAPPPAQHQSEVAPQATEPTEQPRKAAANKE